MIVKISRSKILLNSMGSTRRRRKAKKPVVRCNHCGGLIRHDGELVGCIMCSRDINHICSTCAHARTVETSDKTKQKSA